jgi:ribonuclease G
MKKIVVHCEDGFTKVALLEDQHLIEYYVDQPLINQGVGNIYKGRVVNVLPGMQAAFVDIGQGKNAFLYIDDLLPAHLEKQPKEKPSVVEMVKEGQEILVQVTKEPLGTKGARLTTHFSIPGRWLVYMPFSDYVGISRKVESEAERNRLKMIGEEIRQPGEGLILRTVANGESKKSLENDLNILRGIWTNIREKEKSSEGVSQIYQDLDMVLRLVRDVFTEEIDELIINDSIKALEIIHFLNDISPKLGERVKIYDQSTPIYQYYGVEEELEKAFRSKVWLDNGGYLIFDYTEALTVIDVNTGKFTGSVDLEQTVFDTNMRAAEKIASLLRLRDIGGMIIVDFIDMNQEENRNRIVERLEELMKRDRTKSLVVGWTRLGLLEITRKKVRENIENLITEACPHCNGSGRIYSRVHSLF